MQKEEGSEVKLPEGNGQTEIKMDLTFAKGSKIEFVVDMDIYWNWNVKYINRQIVNHHTMDIWFISSDLLSGKIGNKC